MEAYQVNVTNGRLVRRAVSAASFSETNYGKYVTHLARITSHANHKQAAGN